MGRLHLKNGTGVPISKPRRLFLNSVNPVEAGSLVRLSPFALDFNIQSYAGGLHAH